MPTSTSSLGGASRRVAHRFLALLENRFNLVIVELQEERELILRAVCLALAMAVFGLLACMAITAVIAAAFWNDSPLTVLLVLAGIYSCGGVICYILLLRMKRDWPIFPTTLDQIKKDRECLEKSLV